MRKFLSTPLDIDGWLLDRVFQRGCDAVSGWVTCFDLARAAAVVIILLTAVTPILSMQQIDEPMSVLPVTLDVVSTLITASLFFRFVHQAERKARLSFGNPYRLAKFTRVMLSIIQLTICVVNAIPPIGKGNILFITADLLWIAGFYLVSCTPRPPSRQSSWTPRASFQGA